MYGKYMAEAREKARLTQRQAAAKLGISQGYLAGIEIGRNDPDAWHLIVKMSEVYGTDLNELFGVSGGEIVRETNEILGRLSPERYKEIMEIAKLFLLLDSQEYRSEVIEDLIISSDLFGDGRVTDLLIAAKRERDTLDVGLGLGLGLTDQF